MDSSLFPSGSECRTKGLEDDHADHPNPHGNHDHHHELIKEYDAEKTHIQLKGYEHEGATVVSCSITVQSGCVTNFAWLISALRNIASALENRGAFIGHIKAVVDERGVRSMCSLTEANVPATVSGDSALILDAHAVTSAVVIVSGISVMDALELVGDMLAT